jgi:hypothetical protein
MSRDYPVVIPVRGFNFLVENDEEYNNVEKLINDDKKLDVLMSVPYPDSSNVKIIYEDDEQ